MSVSVVKKSDAAEIVNPLPEVCRVDPIKFNIEVKLNRDFAKSITLSNITNQPIAFKVKTTSRDRYGVRPTQGYIGVGKSQVCEILLAQMKEFPPADIRDKFLVQSVAVANETEDITKFWREKEKEHSPKTDRFAFHEQKIKCKLHVAAKVRAEIASQKGAADAGIATTIGSAAAAAAPKGSDEGRPATAAVGADPVAAGGGRARSGGVAGGSVAGSAAPVIPGAAVTSAGVVVQAPAGVGVTVGPAPAAAAPPPTQPSAALTAAYSEFQPTAGGESVGGSRSSGKSSAQQPVAAAAIPAPAAAAAPAPSTPGGSGSGSGSEAWAQDEYRKKTAAYKELLDQHVKLTLDSERTKREYQSLVDSHNALTRKLEAATKQITQLQTAAATAATSASASAAAPVAAASAPEGTDADGLRRRSTAGTGTDRKDGGSVAVTATVNRTAEEGSVPKMWLLAIAIIFFCLGRIFA